MDEAEVVDAPRAERTGGAPAPASARRVRGRRRVLAAAVVLVGAATLAVGALVGPGGSGGDAAVAAPAEVDVNAALARGLGADFRTDDEHRVVVAAGREAAARLPSGYAFSVGAWAPASGAEELTSLCGPGGSAAEMFAPCTELPVAGGRTATMAWVRDFGTESSVGHALRVLFLQPDGKAVVAAATIDRPVGDVAEQGQEEARAWLAGLAPRIAEALASPLMEGRETGRLAAAQRALLDELGPDFGRGRVGGEARPVPGSDAENALPEGFAGYVTVSSVVPGGQARLAEECAGHQGSSFDTKPCVPLALENGRTVQLQWERRTPADAMATQRGGHTLRVLFLQPDGDIVVVEAGAAGDTATADSMEQAHWWLEDLQPKLAAVATDPDAG